MLTSCLRSRLMVNDDTPTSYLPDWRPGMMSAKLAGCHSVSRPSLVATASNNSTSKPVIVLPSVGIERQTGWSICNFVKAACRYGTV